LSCPCRVATCVGLLHGVASDTGTPHTACAASSRRNTQYPTRLSVSVNDFLDTLGPKIMQPQLRHIVVPGSPGQVLCLHVVQATKSHCIDAGTRAAPGGVLPRYQRLYAIGVDPGRCPAQTPQRECGLLDGSAPALQTGFPAWPRGYPHTPLSKDP